MNCQDCGRKMLLLFTTYSCEHCEGDAPEGCFEGYIVFEPDRPPGEGSSYYVFPSQTDAARWRSKRGRQECELRKVLSETEFQWVESTGTIEGLRLANCVFEIRPDHRFEARPGRAFLAPLKRPRAA